MVRTPRAEQRAIHGPEDSGPPVGYWAYVVDPDGHNLEVSFGQDVGLTVQSHTAEDGQSHAAEEGGHPSGAKPA